MPYGSVLTDNVQSSTANTPTVFKDGNGIQIGTLCRAWVNWNGTGTVAIRASFNVSSITDNGTGDYTVNFTTAMPDANYNMTGTAGGGAANGLPRYIGPGQANPTTTAARITVGDDTGNFADMAYCSISIFR